MLIQLTPNQITNHWDEIKEHLKCALVPQMEVSDEALNNILKGLIEETSQAWVLVGDEDRQVYALGITCFSVEATTNTRNLLIYSLTGYKNVPVVLWKAGLEGLKAFAKANGCFKLIAFTQISGVASLAHTLNGNADTRLIYWEV